MPTITTRRTESVEALQRRLLPRDDTVVREAPPVLDRGDTGGGHRFELIEGPFTSYRRTVTVEGPETVETVEFVLATVFWRWLFRWPVSRSFRRDRPPGRTPWWSPPVRLDARSANVVARACALSVVTGYLGGIIPQALTYVGRDFGAGVGRQSVVLAAMKVGALLTGVVAAAADRHGRRPVMLWCLGLAVAANLVTAIAPGLVVVTVSQTLCRALVAVAALLLPVITVEELPAGARAFAIGLLFMCGALGVGMVLWVLPTLQLSSSAWRGIFALSVLTVPVIAVAARGLPESARFTARRDERARSTRPGGDPADPVRVRRLVVLGLVLVLLNLFVAPASGLQNEFLRTARHFSPTELTLFLLLTNTWSGITVIAAGRLADTRSRHLVAPIGLTGLAVGNALMYATHGWPMWVWSFVGSFVGAATIPAIGVLSPELFPTGRRATANGALNLLAVGGGVIGLLLGGWGAQGNHYARTFAWLAVAPLLAVPLLRLIPETARRDLEELNAPEPTTP